MYIKIVIFHVIKKKLEYKNSLFRVTIEITVKKVSMQIISRTCTLYSIFTCIVVFKTKNGRQTGNF